MLSSASALFLFAGLLFVLSLFVLSLLAVIAVVGVRREFIMDTGEVDDDNEDGESTTSVESADDSNDDEWGDAIELAGSAA